MQLDRIEDWLGRFTVLIALTVGRAVVGNTSVGAETAAAAIKPFQVGTKHRIVAGASLVGALPVESHALEVAIRTRLANFFVLIAVAIGSAKKDGFHISTIPAHRAIVTARTRLAKGAVVLWRPYKGTARTVFDHWITVFPPPFKLEASFNVICA